MNRCKELFTICKDLENENWDLKTRLQDMDTLSHGQSSILNYTEKKEDTLNQTIKTTEEEKHIFSPSLVDKSYLSNRPTTEGGAGYILSPPSKPGGGMGRTQSLVRTAQIHYGGRHYSTQPQTQTQHTHAQDIHTPLRANLQQYSNYPSIKQSPNYYYNAEYSDKDKSYRSSSIQPISSASTNTRLVSRKTHSRPFNNSQHSRYRMAPASAASTQQAANRVFNRGVVLAQNQPSVPPLDLISRGSGARQIESAGIEGFSGKIGQFQGASFAQRVCADREYSKKAGAGSAGKRLRGKSERNRRLDQILNLKRPGTEHVRKKYIKNFNININAQNITFNEDFL